MLFKLWAYDCSNHEESRRGVSDFRYSMDDV